MGESTWIVITFLEYFLFPVNTQERIGLQENESKYRNMNYDQNKFNKGKIIGYSLGGKLKRNEKNIGYTNS